MTELDKIIEAEEKALRDLDKKEQEVLKTLRTNESYQDRKHRGPVIYQLPRSSNLDRILKEQGLSSKQSPENKSLLSPKAKRSKRYYIRKRIENGKPYIPAHIRALGKSKAREMGYKDWEQRALREDEEIEISERAETLSKLRTVMSLIIKTRLGDYLRRFRNGNL